MKARYANLLSVAPETDREKALMEALHDLTLREAHYKGVVAGLQSSVILQQAYVERVHGQLESKEKKSQNEKGALKGGHARLMTEDQVFDEIRAQKEERAQQALEKERRKGMVEQHKAAMDEWKEGEEMRKAWNIAQHEEWEKEVQAWKDSPKPKGKRPLLGKLKKAEPKPTRPTNPLADDDEVSLSRVKIFEWRSDATRQGASDDECDSDV